MSDYGSDNTCCFRCAKFVLTAGLSALFIWLSLRTTKPSCSIENFYLPALNKSDNSNTTRSNHTLFFQLNLNNKMKDKGVRYDDIKLRFYYGTNTSFLIGNYTVPRFYQGHDKKAHKKGMFKTEKLPWDDALKIVSNGSNVVFRVDVTTTVRYKVIFWYSKRHNVTVENRTVSVDGSGKSSAQQLHRYLMAFGFPLSVLVSLLLL
ncbi:protein NDR1-like [Lycium barbarum]|uniref:protein NDR1-like n=1 Tax=Lycium ferocissimum TaxID=112874 RepID=UPI0028168CD8|nr:protein NDR1-like [Lycium ferocissimum]XP_060209189.1 protein NDR1-like [Lycium barbarum]XP_060209190.1 protein NDR1-like [Lycium barbarum]